MLLACLACVAAVANAAAQDLTNTRNFLFVADDDAPLIDVFDIAREAVVYRIETEFAVDHLLVAPDAPLLIYANIDRRSVTFYNTNTKEVANTIELPIAPQHMIMSGDGRRVGISNSVDGGFVLLSVFGLKIDFVVDDFPATSDVLFDANDVDVYFSDPASGALGVLDMNLQRSFQTDTLNAAGDALSSPSRSLDGRYIYVSNLSSGEVFGINAFSKAIYRTFTNGGSPARPYTSPEGLFLYVMDQDSGRVTIYDQQRFETWSELTIDGGSDLVAVGRFDRLSVFLSSTHRRYAIYDNILKRVVGEGVFPGTPIDAQGSADGQRIFVAFADAPQLAILEVETQELRILRATENGAADFAMGQTNNVCH